MSTRALQWPWKLCKIAETMWIWGRLLEVQKYFRQSCRWNIPFPNPCHCIVLKQHAILFCVYILMFTITTRYARQVGGGGEALTPFHSGRIYIPVYLFRKKILLFCMHYHLRERRSHPPFPNTFEGIPSPLPFPNSFEGILYISADTGHFSRKFFQGTPVVLYCWCAHKFIV